MFTIVFLKHPQAFRDILPSVKLQRACLCPAFTQSLVRRGTTCATVYLFAIKCPFILHISNRQFLNCCFTFSPPPSYKGFSCLTHISCCGADIKIHSLKNVIVTFGKSIKKLRFTWCSCSLRPALVIQSRRAILLHSKWCKIAMHSE